MAARWHHHRRRAPRLSSPFCRPRASRRPFVPHGASTSMPPAASCAPATCRLGVPLDATLMVGDRLDTDVAGALRAGIPAVWLRHAGAIPIPGIAPPHVIDRLAELPGWLDATYRPKGTD